MKTIYEKPAYGITKQNYIDGKTLVCVNQFSPKELAIQPSPIAYEAEYELRFKLFSDKYLPFFVDKEEFSRLLTTNIWEITINFALDAEKRTAEKYMKKCGSFDQARITTYVSNLEKLVSKNAETIEKTLIGEGK